MTLFHAVVWTDHQQAQVLQFDAEQVQEHRVKARHHPTAQHGSEVRSQHEFYAELCSALEGIQEVLVTGSRTALADFRHYVEKHRPTLVSRVAGYEAVDHPSERQLLAFAREFFVRFDRMNGTPTPS